MASPVVTDALAPPVTETSPETVVLARITVAVVFALIESPVPPTASPRVTDPAVAVTLVATVPRTMAALMSPVAALNTTSPVALIEAVVASEILSIWIRESEAERRTVRASLARSTNIRSSIATPRPNTKLPAVIVAPGEISTPAGE